MLFVIIDIRVAHTAIIQSFLATIISCRSIKNLRNITSQKFTIHFWHRIIQIILQKDAVEHINHFTLRLQTWKA